MNTPDFWRDRERADAHIKEIGELQDLVKQYREVESAINALRNNSSEDDFAVAEGLFRALELKTLFMGPYDKGTAVISIYPGVGGEDAEDWAKMLEEMYMGYAKRKNWQTRRIDENPRSRTFEVSGPYAYGYLKRESGVHRLVRISPFSAKKLRHTSFALLEVLPDLPSIDAAKFEVPERDLRFEFSRAGGPGGQNVNKVETAVRVVHIPTGLSVRSTAERSQSQNREKAFSLLKAKLYRLMQEHQVETVDQLKAKAKPEWGSQIRSYVLNPYQLVKDHRTETESPRVYDVLAGDIDIFVESEIELLG